MSLSPAPEAPLHVVCYDLSNDRERRRVDRTLCGFGHRRQFSVFECHLSVAGRQQLLAQIERLGLRSGHVLIYRVYAGTSPRTLGVAPPDPDESHCYTL